MQTSINNEHTASPAENSRSMGIAHAAIFALILLFSMMSAVQAGSNQGKGRRGPPQEALDACASLTTGDACSFTGRNDESMSGVCFAPQDKALACKPEGHEQRGGGSGSGEPPQS